MLLRYNKYVNRKNHYEQFINSGRQYFTVMEAMTALGTGSFRMTRLGSYDHLGLSQIKFTTHSRLVSHKVCLMDRI